MPPLNNRFFYGIGGLNIQGATTVIRFLMFVVGAGLSAGILWSMLPIGTAFFVNWLVPFGMEHFLNTDVLRQFLFVCFAAIAPISVLSTIRVARRMHFQATDGRPALLGYVGLGERAAVLYASRAKISALVSAVALVVAFAGAVLRGPVQTEFPAVVAYASLLFAVGLISAIEFNDLRRTAIHGALQSGA